MKIVIANTDSMVEKLIEACAKKTGLKVQHFISLEEIDVSMLEDCFLFVDENALGGDTKRAKQIGSGSLSCLIYSRRKPLDEFKYLVQKPFLPTQVLEILRKELVRRGEDISRVVEEDNDKKAPIEPIKDIPLNEFDLKDEHLFEGNLELPPLPDTDAVETKTSAQSAKEQKEQDEFQNDEENFLDVGENIAHKSLAALERGQSEQGGVSDEIVADMPSDDSSAQSLTESLVGELTEVNALGADSSDSSEMGGLSSDLDGDFGLDSTGDMTSQAPDSAGDIRDSLAGGLDSLDNLGSLDNIDSIDNMASADLESTDNLNPVNSMKGNLAGLGALDNSLDDTLDSSLDSALDSSLDSAEVAQGANMDSADLGGLDSSLESNVNSNVDSNLDSAEGVDLATQIESSESSEASEISEKDELLGGDSLEDLSSLGADLQTDLSNLDESIADSADIAQEMQESSLQETNEQKTSGQEINKTQASDLQETQEAQDLQSSPDFAANGGVLDKDEAKTIQELLNGNSQDKLSQDKISEVADANKTAISQATQTSDIAESTNEKAQEATQETPQQEVAQEDSAQEVAKQSSEVSEEKTAEDIDDFAELNENDIMEVLGEDTPNENAENTLDKQATPQQESQESQEVAKESSTQDAQELAQESSPEPSVDNVADLGVNVAESVKSTSAISKTTQDAEVAQDDTTTQAEDIAQIAQTEEMAESTPQKDEKSADEVASALESADNIEGIDENAEVGDIDGEVLKDLQDNLAQDLEKGLADELPTALQNDLVEGMPPSQDTKQDSAQDDNTEQEDSAERVSRQLKELDSSLEQDLASDIGESSEIMTEDLTNDTESNDLESSGLTGGDLGDEVAKENAELPKSLEELESLVDSSDGDLGELNKLDSIIDGGTSGDGDSSDEGYFSGEDLSADLADSSMQTNADSSLDFIPESGISQYLNIDETSTQESLPKKEQNSAIKSTQKRLITELLANKSAEEISSLLEGAHIHIDIDFSQK
ncbi:hypothetical protein [Helicobacter sp. T3_23-1059]